MGLESDLHCSLNAVVSGDAVDADPGVESLQLREYRAGDRRVTAHDVDPGGAEALDLVTDARG